MRAADTHVLVRLIEQDEARQLAVAEAAVAEGPLWVSTLVLLEVVWVLGSGYRRSKAEIMSLLEVLVENQDLVLEAPEVVRRALDRWGAGAAEFSDYLILEATRAAGHVPLLTFDQRLGESNGVVKL